MIDTAGWWTKLHFNLDHRPVTMIGNATLILEYFLHLFLIFMYLNFWVGFCKQWNKIVDNQFFWCSVNLKCMWVIGTIAKGAALLHQEGAREVYACCTHAVFRYQLNLLAFNLLLCYSASILFPIQVFFFFPFLSKNLLNFFHLINLEYFESAVSILPVSLVWLRSSWFFLEAKAWVANALLGREIN